MFEIAWQFPVRRLENPNLPRQTAVLEPELVVRDSSRRLAA
jgi:DNA-binding LacI/PurR family transcriptional regulator